MAARIFPITLKINIILVLSLAVGIGITLLSITYLVNATLRTNGEENLSQQSDLLYESIKTVMLRGNAPDAVILLENLTAGTAPSPTEAGRNIRLYRTNGVEAFSDNSTIRRVNANLGRPGFTEDTGRPERGPVLVPPEALEPVLGPETPVPFIEPDDPTVLSRYRPLINLPNCTACHGNDHTFRGVIKISNDIDRILRDQNFMLFASGAAYLVLVGTLLTFLTLFLHSTVIDPVKRIGQICLGVREGRFDDRLDLRNNDEIGVLGGTINGMIDGLYERFQLSKFVSRSTIESIRNSEKGEKLRLTVLFSDIRGFTSYAENQPPERVVEQLNDILSLQTQLIQKNGGDVDKYVGDAVLAVFTGEKHELSACRTALEIQEALETHENVKRQGLRVGIGMNTGEVILGMIGSENRADFTVIGDHVNLASRLCNVAGKGEILVSSNLERAVKGAVEVRGPYGLTVKGKQEKQRVYFLTGLKDAAGA